jgi:hypothetical protein
MWTDHISPGWNYHYKITAVDGSGNESDPASPENIVTAANTQLPERLMLYQNVPNPFNPATMINLDLPTATHVRLEIFDTLGRRVRVLVDGEIAAGRTQVRWDGKNSSGNAAASGIYFYRLVAGDFMQTRKMVLLR